MGKKVLLITNSLSGGGAENSMALLHQSFTSQGIDSHLICLNQDKNQNSEKKLPKVIILKRGWGDGILGTLKNFQEFKRAVKNLDADIIVGNCELPELYLSLISLRKYEAYCVEHTSNPWFGRRILGYWVRKVLALKKISWVTVSREASAIWPLSVQPKYIPNPISTPVGNSHIGEAIKLAYVGRLRREKRPDWALSVSEISGLAIDFYGNGPMEAELKNRAIDSKIGAIFHGYTESVWHLISPNTIVVVPSEFEGDGLTVVEAVVRGLPVILAENLDLRRFGLSSNCYFSTPTEMGERLSTFSVNDLDNLRPSQQIMEKYRSERLIESVSSSWQQFLKLN